MQELEDDEDEEMMIGGWYAALAEEDEVISFRRAMSHEEIRLRRVQAKRAEEAVETLLLEKEELEMDKDANGIQIVRCARMLVCTCSWLGLGLIERRSTSKDNCRRSLGIIVL